MIVPEPSDYTRHTSPDKLGWASLSDDGRYRYELGRRLYPDGRPKFMTCTFVMLNPSTADALEDDATIRRCKRFALDWGYDRLSVVNLYAYRAKLPADLWAQKPADRVGAANDFFLYKALNGDSRVICAWGANLERDAPQYLRFLELARLAGRKLMCLGTTKDGHPKHPLYLPAATVPVPYNE